MFRHVTILIVGVFLVAFGVAARQAVAEDVVELVNGRNVRGVVKEIRKKEREFDFTFKISGQTITRTYSFERVHAVTMKGKRFELTPKTAPEAESPSKTTHRSQGEINRLINEVGSTAPDWFDSAPLNYPDTLDVSWPLKPPTNAWQNQKNMGQYIWDIINPNPGRWQSGIKLVNHCMTAHQDNPSLLTRDMKTLASMYFRFYQDYPRAAFWMQKAGVTVGTPDSVRLGECYWRMGNKSMAIAMVQPPAVRGRTQRSRIYLSTIKLLGDIGETEKALDAAKRFAPTRSKHDAALLAGDALRQAGRFKQAIVQYDSVINGSGFSNKDYEKRLKARARESAEAVRLYELLDISKVADGTYSGATTAYNGKLTVEVKVSSGSIESVVVTDHQEKQFYAALTDTPKQIIDKQSVTDIDATSSATITSNAIANAAAKALATK